MTLQPERSDTGRDRVVAEVLTLSLLTLVVRLVNLDHTVFVDELNHVMAASSFLSDGSFALASGMEYVRARPFTYLVAGSFALFGEGLVAARLPAVVFGTALVTVTFLWVRSAAGRMEGWVAGLLLCFAPQAIYHSQLARFYGLQALAIIVVAWCAYRLATMERPGARHIAFLAGGGLISASLAVSAQVSSVVALAGIGVWLLGAIGLSLYRRGGIPRLGAPVMAAMAIAGLVAAAGVAYLVLTIQWRLRFTYFDLWAAEQATNIRFYHTHFRDHYPVLWALFPVVAILALRWRPRPASLWLGIFSIVFLVHTVAAWKADRYIFYVLPFFFATMAIVLAPLLRQLHAEFSKGCSSLFGMRSRAAALAGVLLLIPAVLFAGLANPALTFTRHMLTRDDATWTASTRYRGESDWAAARDHLGLRLQAVDVLVGSSELKGLYFFDRTDYILSATYLTSGSETYPEFTRNGKIDAPMISRPESVAWLIDCHPSGLIVVEDVRWRSPWGVVHEVADLIEARTRSVPMNEGWRMRAFEWERLDGESDGIPPECTPSDRLTERNSAPAEETS